LLDGVVEFRVVGRRQEIGQVTTIVSRSDKP
jgi:hypothetical protein